MAKTVLLDEWHLSVRIPTTLPAATVTAVRRAMNAKAHSGSNLVRAEPTTGTP